MASNMKAAARGKTSAVRAHLAPYFVGCKLVVPPASRSMKSHFVRLQWEIHRETATRTDLNQRLLLGTDSGLANGSNLQETVILDL